MYPNQIQPIESSLRQWFENCSDVIFRHVQLVNEDERWGVLFVYCEGLSDDKLIDQSIIPQLEKLSANQVESDILGNLSFTPLEKEQQSIVDEIFSGKLLVLFDHIEKLYSLDISNPPQRQPGVQYGSIG